MPLCLFADDESGGSILSFLRENGLLLVPPVLGFIAIYMLLPRARRLPALWGGVAAALALILGALILIRSDAVLIERVLFFAFSGIAIGAGIMMVTQSNPVHAALSFAIVVLATCGLFLLQAAPFLMAATIIIYAGAIVVTFLFVIMLAQQQGASNADQRSREPFLASLAGCLLLASLVGVLHRTYDTTDLDAIVVGLEGLSEAKDAAALNKVLGDPREKKDTDRTPDLIKKLRTHITDSDEKMHDDVGEMQRMWQQQKAEEVAKRTKAVLEFMKTKRDAHASLSHNNPPGKASTPGQLPAENVAAVGRSLFTDYLVPVELAATLLLVATIGAIAIAARKSEELR
jgi:NADH:ubiquinone oxidoreductase subunit 6 (subunit J)